MVDTLLLSFIAGFGFSLLGGSLAITPISNALWRGMGWEEGNTELRPYAEHASMVGVVERALYTVSWLLEKPEFVAVWLALKVAGQWSRWGSDAPNGDKKVAGRAIFNVFLLGNAFSIAYGLAGGFLIQSLSSPAPMTGYCVGISLLVGSFAFWLWANRVLRY
jgi:hypothetical protein